MFYNNPRSVRGFCCLGWMDGADYWGVGNIKNGD
jgi:hypothetical protein